MTDHRPTFISTPSPYHLTFFHVHPNMLSSPSPTHRLLFISAFLSACLLITTEASPTPFSTPQHQEKKWQRQQHRPSPSSSIDGHSQHIRGVWPVTKVTSLFGPTIAIFLYDRVYNLYEQYRPFMSAAAIDFTRHLRAAVQSPYASRPLVWLSYMPAHDPSNSNPRVTTTANEIIRLTNIRLREHAVVSRIQMDDDQFEFSKSLSPVQVRNTAIRIMNTVLSNGSGRYLQPEEKIAVHALIASSVY